MQHFHNTPLHYAARHGMKHLIRAFLNEMGGNPNRRNARGQTSLHCVCSVSQQVWPIEIYICTTGVAHTHRNLHMYNRCRP
jgi:hypothetical protein